LALEEIFAPGDAIADLERLAVTRRRTRRSFSNNFHSGLAKPAMRTQPVSRQLGEIVILPARADDRVAVAEDREITLAVNRQIELFADLFFRSVPGDARP
jgi:hypothetical protein